MGNERGDPVGDATGVGKYVDARDRADLIVLKSSRVD